MHAYMYHRSDFSKLSDSQFAFIIIGLAIVLVAWAVACLRAIDPWCPEDLSLSDTDFIAQPVAVPSTANKAAEAA